MLFAHWEFFNVHIRIISEWAPITYASILRKWFILCIEEVGNIIMSRELIWLLDLLGGAHWEILRKNDIKAL